MLVILSIFVLESCVSLDSGLHGSLMNCDLFSPSSSASIILIFFNKISGLLQIFSVGLILVIKVVINWSPNSVLMLNSRILRSSRIWSLGEHMIWKFCLSSIFFLMKSVDVVSCREKMT